MYCTAARFVTQYVDHHAEGAPPGGKQGTVGSVWLSVLRTQTEPGPGTAPCGAWSAKPWSAALGPARETCKCKKQESADSSWGHKSRPTLRGFAGLSQSLYTQNSSNVNLPGDQSGDPWWHTFGESVVPPERAFLAWAACLLMTSAMLRGGLARGTCPFFDH